MAKIYYEKDVNGNILKRKKISVLGFGSQGHAHALNLKESGYNVVVGLKENSKSREIAKEQDLEVLNIADAVKSSDVIMMLLPDEVQAEVYGKDVAENLKEGNMLMFAHGFSIHFSQIVVPENIDVTLIAPKSPGHIVRREFENGKGVPGLIAVYQDYTKNAFNLALEYGKGVGLARAGIFETTFKEETETDLFGEQAVLCGGVTSLMKAGFETLVNAGYQPEMAYFECINEMKLIVDLIYEGGFSKMRDSISNTAEFGDYITQQKLITSDVKNKMKEILKDIQNGRFAKEWILEKQSGLPFMKANRNIEKNHKLEEVGEKLRKMMAWNK